MGGGGKDIAFQILDGKGQEVDGCRKQRGWGFLRNRIFFYIPAKKKKKKKQEQFDPEKTRGKLLARRRKNLAGYLVKIERKAKGTIGREGGV